MSDQYFSRHHLWVQPVPDGSYNVGISEHAQHMLGDIVFVEPPTVGQRIQAEQACGMVESVKTASDLHAPVNGTVIAVNTDVTNNPELLDDNPEQHWIFRIKPDSPEDIGTLMDRASYEAFLA